MDHASLRIELSTDPLALGYGPHLVAKNDEAIAQLLNAKSYSSVGIVTNDQFSLWAASTGMRSTIEDLAADKASPLRASALSLLDMLRGQVSRGLHLSHPTTASLLDAWVNAGALPVAARDALFSLASIPASRGEQLFGDGVVVSAVDVARATRDDLGNSTI